MMIIVCVLSLLFLLGCSSPQARLEKLTTNDVEYEAEYTAVFSDAYYSENMWLKFYEKGENRRIDVQSEEFAVTALDVGMDHFRCYFEGTGFECEVPDTPHPFNFEPTGLDFYTVAELSSRNVLGEKTECFELIEKEGNPLRSRGYDAPPPTEICYLDGVLAYMSGPTSDEVFVQIKADRIRFQVDDSVFNIVPGFQ
ncbi:hypothetical protein GF342_03280 [Candidatus Woesearchaeota archaeon]|nr:hypothetical protein [Candidatus Woesearchaeota archaeon]